MKTLKTKFAVLVNQIVALFSNLNGSKFVGIKAYRSSTSGEVADHVIVANFSYKKAVKKDLAKLQTAKDSDYSAIAEKFGFSIDLIKQAIEKLSTSFINNLNPETASKGSTSQSDAYLRITKSIKLHIESGMLHIYGLTIPESKVIISEGEYKKVNSKELTLCQNAVKKYFDFTTTKYRNFVISPDQLSAVNISGEKVSLK